ncbi:translation initiation factor IF-2-like [Phacochoerus africanus]|uniref:translation initiation factor IF-2-like n=1 Tax=Phacochoerus africanus TaxID=41426 RepID=UPI001FD8B423|nr:translation initiation factor IF-2-like [Phacochoerus africanus]
MNWLQPAAATERGSRRREGDERAGPEEPGVARSYLTPSVSSVSSSTAAAPAVAAAATFLGSAPAAAASSSTLCSPLCSGALTERRVPSATSPRPPQHTRPETLKPYGSCSRVTHPPSLPATSGGPVPPPSPAPAAAPASLPARTAGRTCARAATLPAGGGAAAQPRRGARAHPHSPPDKPLPPPPSPRDASRAALPAGPRPCPHLPGAWEGASPGAGGRERARGAASSLASRFPHWLLPLPLLPPPLPPIGSLSYSIPSHLFPFTHWRIFPQLSPFSVFCSSSVPSSTL